MKQNRIESQTTQILFQGPTKAEQRTPRKDLFIANAKDAAKFAAIAIPSWVVVSGVASWMFGG